MRLILSYLLISDGHDHDRAYNGGHAQSSSDRGDIIIEWSMKPGTLIEWSIMAITSVWSILQLFNKLTA